MEYTVDYFIAKFEAIPEDKWITGSYNNEHGCCAYGHCGMRNEHIAFSDSKSLEPEALAGLMSKVGHPDDINDGYCKKYQQPTPKQRILAALRDIKKVQESSQMLSSEPNVQASVATGDASSNWLDKTKNFTSLIPIPDEVSDLKLIEN